MRVYISGAITGTKDYRERFAAAEEKLKGYGLDVINPVKVAESMPDMTYDEIMSIDIRLLKMCDAVHFLKGFGKSKGARFEYFVAKKYGKELMFEEVKRVDY